MPLTYQPRISYVSSAGENWFEAVALVKQMEGQEDLPVTIEQSRSLQNWAGLGWCGSFSWSVVLYTERLWVQLPVRTCTLVAGLILLGARMEGN